MATKAKGNKMEIGIVGDSRERVGRQQDSVELDDEVFGKLNGAGQLIIALHEKFIGTVDSVGVYQDRYYVLNTTVDAVGAVFEV